MLVYQFLYLRFAVLTVSFNDVCRQQETSTTLTKVEAVKDPALDRILR